MIVQTLRLKDKRPDKSGKKPENPAINTKISRKHPKIPVTNGNHFSFISVV